MKKFLAYMAMAITVAASGNAVAHGQKPEHGGIVQTVNDLSFELVNKDGKAVVYVTDHGKKFPTEAATGKMTILQGTAKSEVALESSGENTLTSKETVSLPKGSKAIASINFENKEPMNVRFAVK